MHRNPASVVLADSNKVTIGALGGIRLFMAVLSLHHDNTTIIEATCGAIKNVINRNGV